MTEHIANAEIHAAAGPSLRGRLRHRHRIRHAAAGPERGHRARSSRRKKDEPEWMTDWRLAAYRHWLTMTSPHWAKLEIAPIDFQAISYYSAPKGPKYAVARRGAAGTARHLRQARRAAARARAAGRRGGRRGVRLGLGRHHVPQGTGREGRDLLLDVRGDPRASGTGAAVPRQRGADRRQLSSRRSTRRCSPTAASSSSRRACAARWSCRPTSASTRATPASSSAR